MSIERIKGVSLIVGEDGAGDELLCDLLKKTRVVSYGEFTGIDNEMSADHVTESIHQFEFLGYDI